MVVVPNPHAAAHQKANARELVEAGAATLVMDEDFDADALLAAADLATDRDRLARMREATLARSRPNAAGASIRLLEALAAREPLPDPAEVERLSRAAA
jgi:UDP-N-acetylglucosamine:LPS N-acetylglucosamine transferase